MAGSLTMCRMVHEFTVAHLDSLQPPDYIAFNTFVKRAKLPLRKNPIVRQILKLCIASKRA